jgi:hypothetical protein
MKLHADDGSIAWLETVGGPAGKDDIAWSVVVGPDDNPVITGFMVGAEGSAHFRTIKFDKADHSLIWDRVEPGAVNNVSRAGWLAVAEGGDIVMVNRTWSSISSYDVVLRRYAAADGATVYARVYDSPDNRLDDPRDMVCDDAGDIYVAGVHSSNYMVLKFDGATGDTLWTNGYDGPPGWYDVADCVALNASGEVILSGFSDGSGSGWDVATVGFDAATGDRHWVARFDGQDSQADEGRVIACSDLGDIYVAGYSYSIVSNMDLLALRYCSADVSGVADETRAPRLAAAYPNPFNPRVWLAVEMPAAGVAQVVIFDLQGRRIADLQDGPLTAGTHTFAWDGRDERGQPAAAGAYLACLKSGSLRQSQKILLAK